MRYARRFSVPTRWRAGLPLCFALALGCHGEVGPAGPGTPQTPVCDATDPTQVIESQRIMLITSTQLLNMVSLLVSPEEADFVATNGIYQVTSEYQARFPPAKFETLRSIQDSTALSIIDLLAQHIGGYVRDHFAAVTKCATPGTDACAVAWLDNLAVKAYRRPLSQGEKDRFTGQAGLYYTLRSQLVNGCQVTTSVEQATGNAVYALFMTPQLLWRWELGNAQTVSAAPAGVYLTEAELASNLAFFLTDAPPDDMLVAAAGAGTLRANLASHVDRILQTQTARDWLTRVVKMYFTLNQLSGVIIDDTKFPIVAGGALFADLEVESQKFLYDIMWNGKVMDLITSRKAFLNSNLATMVYGVDVPPGATPTNFVETTLPADERSGMLTNAGFITRTARAQGVGVIPRGLGVKALFLCLETPPPPMSIAEQVEEQKGMLDNLTAQEQVASRATTAPCSACHPSFDPYGLVLDWYDVIGRFRTTDDLGKPVDGTTKLPPDVGGATVHSALELADELTKSTVFMNCMARTMLQYGMTDATVELPVPAKMQRGCAAAGVANAVQRSSNQSFTDMVRAVAASPAFVLRKQVQ